MVRLSEATGSGIAASTNIMVQGQGNQVGSITQSVGNIGGSGAPYCQNCGYSHYERCGRAGVCFRCGQSGHMKKDFSLNVSRPTYGTTVPFSVVAPTHTTGSVAQPTGRGTSSRGA